MLNTYGDISPRVGTKSAAKLLRVGQPLMHTQRFAQVDDQPMRSGKVRKWRRYHTFPALTAPVAEGVTPESQALTFTDYTATLEEYVAITELTDQIADTHEDPVLKVMMERSGQQFAETIETLTINFLKGGTNVVYASGVASRGTVAAAVTLSDIRLVQRGFARARATKLSRVIAPTSKISTMGVEAGYFAMGHTDLDADIRDITGFKTIVEYGNPGSALPGEIGAVEQVRFLTGDLWSPWLSAGAATTDLLANGVTPASSLACDVYPLVVVAQDGYAVVQLQGRKAVHIMVLNPNVPRGGDAAGQRGSVSWKTYFAGVITNEQWVCRVEVGATANP